MEIKTRPIVAHQRKKYGFEAVTSTDYLSRSHDPKIMDDFFFICNIDWSNGPVISPNKEKRVFPVCHVDESVLLKQIINIVGTTFWTVQLLNSKMNI